MKAFIQILERAMSPVRKALYVAIVTMFGLQVIVVFSQVVSRYIFNDPFSWSEELARYLQVWIILLTSAVCIKEGTHLLVDYLVHYLSFLLKKILKIIVMLLIMLFVVVLITSGIKMMSFAGTQPSPALHFPMWIVYLVFPVSGVLMFLESLVVLLKTSFANSKEELEKIGKEIPLKGSAA